VARRHGRAQGRRQTGEHGKRTDLTIDLKFMWPWRKNKFEEIMRKHIDKDFSVFAAGENAPSKSVINDFEKSIGYSLPNDFKEFSTTKLGGVYIEVKEELWPRPKEFAIGPFWSFLYGLMVYGFGTEIPEMMDIRIQTKQFNEGKNGKYAPFLKIIGNADEYCFDENQLIRRWDHETGEMPVVEKTFTEVLSFEVEELRKRKDRKLAERKTS
jgi:hypothetical protein